MFLEGFRALGGRNSGDGFLLGLGREIFSEKFWKLFLAREKFWENIL